MVWFAELLLLHGMVITLAGDVWMLHKLLNSAWFTKWKRKILEAIHGDD